jgi:hypothetical protein
MHGLAHGEEYRNEDDGVGSCRTHHDVRGEFELPRLEDLGVEPQDRWLAKEQWPIFR